MTWRDDAAVIVRAGTDWDCSPVWRENWRIALCATALHGGGNSCPLPVLAIWASVGRRTRQVPYMVAEYCTDPCSEILWDSLVNARNNQTAADKVERAKRRAARAELAALEQQARSLSKP